MVGLVNIFRLFFGIFPFKNINLTVKGKAINLPSGSHKSK